MKQEIGRRLAHAGFLYSRIHGPVGFSKKITVAICHRYFFVFFVLLRCNEDIEYNRQNDEYEEKNRRDTTKDLILGLTLALREEGLGRRTCDRTRKTLILAGLREYTTNQNDSKYDNYDSQCNFHLRTPPNLNILTPPWAEIVINIDIVSQRPKKIKSKLNIFLAFFDFFCSKARKTIIGGRFEAFQVLLFRCG